MSYTDTQIESVKEEHNALLLELKATENEGVPEGDAEREQWNADLDGKYARVQDLRAQFRRLSERKLTEMEPISSDALPLAMTAEGEQHLLGQEEAQRDPLEFWMANWKAMGIPDEGERDGNFSFKLKHGADVLLGMPRYRMGVDSAGIANGIQFADPTVSVDVQDSIPGLGMAPPTQRPPSFLREIAQVETPMSARDVRFMRGTIRTDIGLPVADASPIAASVINWDDETRKLVTVGTRTRQSRPAMMANAQFLPWLQEFLGQMVQRRASDQAVNGNGTTPQFNGIASETYTGGRNNEVAMGSNAATAFLQGVGNAHDDIAYNLGGMPTHVIARHEAVAEIRNATNDEGVWRAVQFFDNDPALGYLGMRLAPTAELPAYAATSRVAYVGDFSAANVFLARQSDMNVVVGLNDDDLSRNVVTVVVTLEANLIVKVPNWIEVVTRTS